MYKALHKKSIIKFVIKKYFKIYDYVLQRAQSLQPSSNSVLTLSLRIVLLKTASDL